MSSNSLSLTPGGIICHLYLLLASELKFFFIHNIFCSKQLKTWNYHPNVRCFVHIGGVLLHTFSIFEK